MKKENIKYNYTNEVVCPYCGYEFTDSWEYADEGDVYCETCENDFTYERVVTVEYRSYK